MMPLRCWSTIQAYDRTRTQGQIDIACLLERRCWSAGRELYVQHRILTAVANEEDPERADKDRGFDDARDRVRSALSVGFERDPLGPDRDPDLFSDLK